MVAVVVEIVAKVCGVLKPQVIIMRAVFCKIAITSNQVMVCLGYIKHTFVPLNDIEIKYIDKKLQKFKMFVCNQHFIVLHKHCTCHEDFILCFSSYLV